MFVVDHVTLNPLTGFRKPHIECYPLQRVILIKKKKKKKRNLSYDVLSYLLLWAVSMPFTFPDFPSLGMPGHGSEGIEIEGVVTKVSFRTCSVWKQALGQPDPAQVSQPVILDLLNKLRLISLNAPWLAAS